jgi:mono/diheme cytochrome c family protein
LHRRSHRILTLALLVVALLAFSGILGLRGGAFAAPEIPRAALPSPTAFDAQQVRRGEQLAAIGDCAGCHSVPGGAAFAGGVAVPTPFGTIYGTNITPEPATGIGQWSLEAFQRALRQGISRDGHNLYPAFPYNHFTHMTDADIASLYAFLMTRDAVRATPPANQLMFPLQFRPLVAAWNFLYLKEGPLPQTSGQPPAYLRGAYLVDSLAHCAACHSGRNALGAEKKDAYLAGGEAEGWHASALNADSPSPRPWTAEALATYLRSGIAEGHAMTAGPMHQVVASLSRADPADVAAIANYITSQMGPGSAQSQARAEGANRRAALPSLATAPPSSAGGANDEAQMQLGANVYATSCASCHDAGRGASSNAALKLPLAVALHLPKPDNLVRIVREGIQPLPGEPGRWMPPFAGVLSDEQLAAVVAWLRRQGTDQAPWDEVAGAVAKAKKANPTDKPTP